MFGFWSISTKKIADAIEIITGATGRILSKLVGAKIAGQSLDRQRNIVLDDSPSYTSIGGNIPHLSSVNPFGKRYSLQFFGDGGYLTVPHNAALDFQGGDFTVEAWIYPTVYSRMDVISKANTNYTGYAPFVLSLSSITSKRASFYGSFTGNNWSIALTASVDYNLNEWTHFACVRNGTQFTLYQNGVSVATANLGTSPLVVSTENLGIGGTNNGGFLMNGYISNVRLVKGTAVYTGNFTPPSELLTNISGTSLLTCQNGYLKDNSINNFAITGVGKLKSIVFTPFETIETEISAPETSASFTANGTWSVGPNTSIELGIEDFTIEGWVYLKSTANMGMFQIGSAAPGLQTSLVNTIALASANGIWYVYCNNRSVTGNSTATTNTWHHFAIARSNGTTRLYINGNIIFTEPDTVNYTCNYLAMGGYYSTGYFLNGYLSNFRIIKGTALYTSNFNSPSEPLTDVSGTSLLTFKGYTRLIDHSSNKFEIVTYNTLNAITTSASGPGQISANSPFEQYANTSVYFDGNGDYLTVPHNAALDFQGGDFTVEIWVYPTVYSRMDVLNKGTNATYSPFMLTLSAVTSKRASFYGSFTGGSWNIALTASVDYNLNVWTHFACVRNGTQFTLYQNGVSVATANLGTSPLVVSTENLGIGGTNNGGFLMNGYISNVRLVKGTAVYTGNFTPPSELLTNISGTSLLTCQGSSIVDNSSNNFAITTFGNVSISNYGPPIDVMQINTGSMFLGGDTHFSSVTIVNIDKSISASTDFCCEAWIYPTKISSDTDVIFGGSGTSTSTNDHQFYIQSNNTGTSIIGIRWRGSNILTSGSRPVVANTWQHVAFTRASGIFRIFVNGVNVATSTANATAGNIANIGVIPSTTDVNSRLFSGYMSNIKITTNSPVYTSYFVPVQFPVQPTPNTVLDLKFRHLVLYDKVSSTTASLIGNLGLLYMTTEQMRNNTPVIKNFSGSVEVLNRDDFVFGTNDFTIEFWVYVSNTTTSNYPSLVDFSNGQVGSYPRIYYDRTQSNVLKYYTNNADRIIGGAIQFGTWVHVALSKYQGNTKLFINGNQTGDTYVDSNNYTNDTTSTSNFTPKFGQGSQVSNTQFIGYMSDINIYRYAKYNSDFTPE